MLTVSQNICNLLVQNKAETVYYRMDASYQQFISEEDFVNDWKQLSESANITEKSKITVNFGKDNLKTMTNVYARLKGKSDIYIKFTFTSTASLPANISFSKTKYADGKLSTDYSENLKDLCKDYFKIGTGLTGYSKETLPISLPKYMELTEQHFSSCTFTNMMKPVYILDQRKSMENLKNGNSEPVLNFDPIDETLTWCMEHKVPVRGHTLIWHTQAPLWFFNEGYETNGVQVSREVMIERTDSYIRQYMEHVQTKFPDTVYCWDVVNEAVDSDAGNVKSPFHCRTICDNQPTPWYTVIGDDYPIVAFQIARKYAAPGVKLIYNDYSTIKLWSTLDIEVMITEWSTSPEGTSPDDFEKQGQRYASIFRLLQKLDKEGGGPANITCVSFFIVYIYINAFCKVCITAGNTANGIFNNSQRFNCYINKGTNN